MSNLDNLTTIEEKELNESLNNSLSDFIEAIPFVELGDTSDGNYSKLRVQEKDGKFSIGDIFFELQWLLHIKKKRNPDITKLIVSDLQLTPIIPNSTFRRGIMIRMKYI